MPELPEVETTRAALAPLIVGQLIRNVVIRNRRLRRPIAPTLRRTLIGAAITAVGRRGKYILCALGDGCLLIHLGMSGSLRVVNTEGAPKKHDHVDIVFASGRILRFHDPRRFGTIVWTKSDPLQHEFLRDLGPEPLTDQFDGECLYRRSRRRRLAIKNFIMDQRTVVGVGNIYANESLFMAKIDPKRRAGRISRARYHRLAEAIKATLAAAIRQGGTTLRDFVNGAGKPGYFRQYLTVYQRTGQPCVVCQKPIKRIKIGQHSVFYCSICQT